MTSERWLEKFEEFKNLESAEECYKWIINNRQFLEIWLDNDSTGAVLSSVCCDEIIKEKGWSQDVRNYDSEGSEWFDNYGELRNEHFDRAWLGNGPGVEMLLGALGIKAQGV